jgi:TetR/AcrR family transcriptional regulator
MSAVASERRGAASADQLIEATAALLAESTVLDVSLSEIAARSGLNSALIKYYFGNKEGLLLALLERDAAVEMQALDHLVGLPIGADEKLRLHIRAIITAYYRLPYLNRLIHYMIERGGPAASKRVATIFVEPMLAAYRAIVAQGVAEGTLRPVDPAFLYYSLAGSCDHLFHAATSAPVALGPGGITEEVKERYIAHVTDLCLHGLMLQGDLFGMTR